jgi:alcohol dehydrogenase class IV
MALANAKLGAVHGLAGPLGGMFPIPHGVVCGQLLPHVMAANVRALQSRDPESPALDRYNEIARILTGNADAKEGVAWVWELCEAMKFPRLTRYGLKAEDFPVVAEKAMNASSMKGNPIRLTAEELVGILHRTSGD